MSIAREITDLLAARAAAVAAHDVEGVMRHVADDIISFDVGKPLVHTGGAEVRRRLEAWFAGYDGPIGFEFRDLTVRGEDNIAFSHALVHVSGQLKNADSVSMWVRSTICWMRRGERWMAVHEHMSDPMDFETGMARTDLEPESSPGA
jgi:ketosteroid isomerase-like protein